MSNRLNILRLIVLIVFILIGHDSNAGERRVWIFFKDKGPQIESLAKRAGEALSPRSMERRSKRGNIKLCPDDLPVYPGYIDQLRTIGVEIHHKSKWFNAVSAYLHGVEIAEVRNLPFVKGIEQVRSFRYRSKISVPYDLLAKKGTEEYGLSENQNKMIGIPAAHTLGYKGKGVLIAVFDTGFLLEHEALQHIKPVAAYDFVQGDDNVANEPGESLSQHNHGTMVLATIGGYAPGNLVGPAYEADYILAKTEDISSETHVEEDNWVAAAEWADSLGADIITTSLGYSEFDPGEGDYTYEDMDGKSTIITRGANRAASKGIAVFASAGNEGNSAWYYITAPADGDSVVAMGGALPDGMHWSTSSRGPTSDGRIKPDLIAQGQSVYTINPSTDNKYSSASGTSFSCPLGAGAGAIVLGINPSLTPMDLRELLISTATQTANPNNNMGYGLIDLQKTIAVVLEQPIVAIDSFKGQGLEGRNVLFWQSVLEVKNESWIVTRKIANNREEEIGSLKGQNFSLDQRSYYFNDIDLIEGELYTYYLKAALSADENMLVDSVDITSLVPQKISITDNYPNPFNSGTTITVSLNVATQISLEVFDIEGRKVRTLINNVYLDSGFYRADWDGLNDQGNTISSGTYLVLLKSPQASNWYKVLLLK